MVDGILRQLSPLIEQRESAGTQALLDWKALMAPLDETQRAWLQTFRYQHGMLEPSSDNNPPKLVPVEKQYVLLEGEAKELPRQYLPEPAYRQYQRMMSDMENALNTYLRVDSGYRSPAYQMFLFLKFMPRHAYSVSETHRFVAFPGESEHGSLTTPAIDFINVHGINGEENPRDFEVLPEFRWLYANAENYGFELSYPVESSTDAYEPWHWRYVGVE